MELRGDTSFPETQVLSEFCVPKNLPAILPDILLNFLLKSFI